MSAAWIVFRKELLDALRDRRTLLTIVLSSVAVGPLVLWLMSTLVAGIEARADAREVVVAGIGHAPTLRNYIERQTYRLRPAPADYEAQLRDKRLGEAVLVVGEDFESALLRGEPARVELVLSSANPRAQADAARVSRLLQGFAQEQAMLRLAWRGTSPLALQAIDIDERDLASPAARAAQWASLVPFFVLMAVLYGALNAALDTTAGERERGSLEPLLIHPVSSGTIVLGKWAACRTRCATSAPRSPQVSGSMSKSASLMTRVPIPSIAMAHTLVPAATIADVSHDTRTVSCTVSTARRCTWFRSFSPSSKRPIIPRTCSR